MSSQKRSRRLGFESLEWKAAPSATLLAQLGIAEDAAIEHGRVADSAGHAGEADKNWRYRHSTVAVLEFVEGNAQEESVSSAWTLPTQDQASQADHMMARGIDSMAQMPSD